MLITILGLILGFVLLIKGADYFVEGSSSLADRFGIPPMIVGLTIVAMGTSLPELSVSFTSALAGYSDMSIANAIGSNIFNILAILGVSSLFGSLPVSQLTIDRDLKFLFRSTVLLLILAFFGLSLNILDGLVFVALFIGYIVSMVKQVKKQGPASLKHKTSLLRITLYIVLGAIGIIWGGNLVVNGASTIASALGMSQNLIGLTIVAVGTSLPEFVTSVTAARKGELDIAIGNVVGSNIFNILFVLGISSIFNPLTISAVTFIDIIFSALISLVLILICKSKHKISKHTGIWFIIVYISYILFTIVR